MPIIEPLATLTPPSTSRTWLSAPHPNLPIIATACSDKTVRIYSLSNFKLLSTISGGHKRSIRSLAWKPGSGPTVKGVGIGESVLATASFDASAGIWRRWEGTSGYIKRSELEHDVTRVRDTENEIDDDDEAEHEEDQEWRFAVVLEGHDSEIKSIAFCLTSPLIATCSRDKSVWIWEEMDNDDFETVAVLQEHDGDVKCVAWHPTEELLASASYDDTIRLWREDIDDWTCCACLRNHTGTVWWVEFEHADISAQSLYAHGQDKDDQEHMTALQEARRKAGPRLLSCSDDLSIKVWRRLPKDKKQTPTGQGRMPSIIRTNDIEEDWVEEAELPKAHERAIYTVSWSKISGRIVSCGSDGKIVVYQECWRPRSSEESRDEFPTEWQILAEFQDCHGVYEINHVCWAKRSDDKSRNDQEEVIVSTGDDGEVKVWSISE